MSLLYAANDSVISTISFSTLEQGTWLGWFRANVNTDRSTLFEHRTGESLTTVTWRGDIAGDPFRAERQRVSGYQQAWTDAANFAAYGLNKWLFGSYVWDITFTDVAQVQLRIGDLRTRAAEPSSYDTHSLGAGAITSTPGFIGVGCQAAGGSSEWPGDVAWSGYWNRPMTVDEIWDQQFNPHVTDGCLQFIHLGSRGPGLQRDESGKSNHGVVSGARMSHDRQLYDVFRRHRKVSTYGTRFLEIDSAVEADAFIYHQTGFRFRADDSPL